ncbi:MAG: leucine-rich repeat domain-containing protein [Ruminococcus callidus]
MTLPAATVDTINSSCFYGCTVLEQVSLAEGNTAFTVTDGVLFSANGEDLIVYPQAMEGTSYTIPDTVREIWTSAFSNTKLTDVTFPDGLLYIDDWAFASSALTSLDLPDTVTEIGQYAFAYCTGISEIDMPKNLELIQAAAFAGETSLTKVTFYDSLTDIQMAAFAGTGLKEVTIPESVSTIGFCAFGYEADMVTKVQDFVIYGKVGSQAEVYCTAEDSENDYSNNFKFRSVMSEEVSGSDSNTVEVTEKENLWQSYGRWILLGAGAVVLLVGGGILIFAGGGKKKRLPLRRKMTRQRKRQKKRQKKQRQSRTRIPNENVETADLRTFGNHAVCRTAGCSAGSGGNDNGECNRR